MLPLNLWSVALLPVSLLVEIGFASIISYPTGELVRYTDPFLVISNSALMSLNLTSSLRSSVQLSTFWDLYTEPSPGTEVTVPDPDAAPTSDAHSSYAVESVSITKEYSVSLDK